MLSKIEYKNLISDKNSIPAEKVSEIYIYEIMNFLPEKVYGYVVGREIQDISGQKLGKIENSKTRRNGKTGEIERSLIVEAINGIKYHGKYIAPENVVISPMVELRAFKVSRTKAQKFQKEENEIFREFS